MLPDKSPALEGEHVVTVIRPHPVTLLFKIRRPILVAILFFVLALIAARAQFATPILPLILLGLAFLLPVLALIAQVAEWWEDFYLITSHRVIHNILNPITGRKRREETLLRGVQSVDVSFVGGRFTGLGRVIVNRIGQQGPIIIGVIDHPLRIQEILLKNVPQFANAAAQNMPNQVNHFAGQAPAEINNPPSALPPIVGTATPFVKLSNVPIPAASSSAPAVNEIWRAIIPHMRYQQGDRVFYRKHWLVLFQYLWKPTLAYIGLLILLILTRRIAFLEQVPGSVIVIAGIVWLVINTIWWYWEYVSWREDIYIVDNQWIIDIQRRPFWLHETRKQAGLYQIQNVSSEIKGFWGQLFKKGDVVINTAAEQGTMVFVDVYNPAAVANDILQRLHHNEPPRNNKDILPNQNFTNSR